MKTLTSSGQASASDTQFILSELYGVPIPTPTQPTPTTPTPTEPTPPTKPPVEPVVINQTLTGTSGDDNLIGGKRNDKI